MDYYYSQHRDIKSMNHSKKLNYLKMITRILLLSVSVFSLLFSHSTLVPVIVQSYDYLVSNFTFKITLFTYTAERNCIFLLCNGILVLIFQSSGLISKIAPAKSGSKDAIVDDHYHGQVLQENEKKGIREEEILEESGREINGSDVINIAAEVEGEEDEEDVEEEGIDRDELYKKCEDFIKKAKQDLQDALR